MCIRDSYKNYGLAIEGLVRHHQIDALEYNAKVDDALPLDGVIKPRPELKKLLEDIDRSKVRLWLFTNAYVNHAHRVIRLLGIDGMFEGVTYCDYSKVPFVCKPHKDAYVKAMKEAGVEKWEDCFFVGECHCHPLRARGPLEPYKSMTGPLDADRKQMTIMATASRPRNLDGTQHTLSKTMFQSPRSKRQNTRYDT